MLTARGKTEARRRVARMEGQLRGVLSMLEGDRSADEILTQIASLRAALAGLGEMVLERHVHSAIHFTSQSQDATERDEVLQEVLRTIGRLIR